MSRLSVYIGIQSFSRFADVLAFFATSIWVVDQSGSAGDLATILALGLGVRILWAPFMGTLSDRLARTSVLIAMEGTRFIITTTFALWIFYGGYHFMALCFYTVFMSSLTALSRIIYPTVMANTLYQNSATRMFGHHQIMQSMADVFAGALGGWLFSAVDISFIFMIDGISYLTAAACLFFLIQQKNVPTSSDQENYTLRQGWHFIKSRPEVWQWAGLFILLSLFLAPVAMMTGLLSQKGMTYSSLEIGLLSSAFGVGMAWGALGISKLNHKNKSSSWGLVVAILFLGISVPGLFLSSHWPVALLSSLLIGAGLAFANVSMYAFVAQKVTQKFRGQVYGFIECAVLCARALGFLLWGHGVAQGHLSTAIIWNSVIIIPLSIFFIGRGRIFIIMKRFFYALIKKQAVVMKATNLSGSS